MKARILPVQLERTNAGGRVKRVKGWVVGHDDARAAWEGAWFRNYPKAIEFFHYTKHRQEQEARHE